MNNNPQFQGGNVPRPMPPQGMPPQGMPPQGMNPNMPPQGRPMPLQGGPMPPQGGMMPPQGDPNGVPPVQQPTKVSLKDLKKLNYKDPKNWIILVSLALIGVIVVVLIINIIGTKTLTCKEKTEIADVMLQSVEKVKFKFGKPYSEYSKVIMDYSETEFKKEEVKERVKAMKESAKENCKRKDGCSYSISQSGMKITVVSKQKYKKEDKEKLAKKYDSFKEYKEYFDESCDDEK